jgi:mRNA interferase RelE/StbE
MAYQVAFRPGAVRALEKLPRDVQARLLEKVASLADTPRPVGVQKLRGPEDIYRVRVGSYRILYTIDDKGELVVIADVGDRKDVYR